MLYAMRTSGADAVVCLGGVQALAAMAFGVGELEPVDMLVGAGNAYVAEAKRQLFGRVGIDLLAGPTEVLVIADETADPHLVAADLLGQAEHGPTSPAGVIASARTSARARHGGGRRAAETWPTADVAGAAWRDHGWVGVADDDDEAIALADEPPTSTSRCRSPKRAPMYLDAAAQLRLAVPRRAGDGRLRRQGGRHQPRPADGAAPPLHGRALGRQVPQDLHVPGADAGGHAPRSRPPSRRSARRRTSPATG